MCTSADGEIRVPYLVGKLKNCHVTHYHIGGATEGEAVPTEEIALDFEEICWTYFKLSKKNDPLGTVEAKYNLKEGK